MDSALQAPRARTILLIGYTLTAAFASTLIVMMNTLSYDAWGTLIMVPFMVALTVPVLARAARRDGDRMLFWLLLVALLLKFGGAIARQTVAFDVYDGVADASGYHTWGTAIAHNFRAGIFDAGLPSLSGTDFIRFLTGLVYTVIGPNRLGGFLFFSWMSFWGMFLLTRAYSMAVPEGRRRTYVRLLIFMPSMVYWPSSIGKEAWMLLSIGIIAWSVARLFTHPGPAGAVAGILGLSMAAVVRPHIAAMFGIAAAVGALFRKQREDLGELRPVIKGITVLVLGVVAIVLVGHTRNFLDESGVQTTKGFTGALQSTTLRTTGGGSRYDAPALTSPKGIPVALITVLFRPFPNEAENPQVMLTAIEGSFLLVFCVVRFRWLLAAARLLRRQGYVAFAAAFAFVFVAAFSSIGNFGLLARERVQLFPMFVVLLSIPPKGHRHAVQLPPA